MHATPAQGLRSQRPSTQSSSSAQATPSHGPRATQRTWHAAPSPHAAAHGRSGAHRPAVGSQNWPAGHATPAHGTGRQPATHAPSTQVSPSRHVTPAQRSRSGTHCARHESAPQVLAGPRHGSSAQRPPRQRWPRTQWVSLPQRPPTGGASGAASAGAASGRPASGRGASGAAVSAGTSGEVASRTPGRRSSGQPARSAASARRAGRHEGRRDTAPLIGTPDGRAVNRGARRRRCGPRAARRASRGRR